MRPNSRRTLGWALLAGVLVLAGGFALRVLRSPEPEPPTSVDASRPVLEHPTTTNPAPVIEAPPDRPKPPPAEPAPAQTGAISGRVMTSDRREAHDARIEAFRGNGLGLPLFGSLVVSWGERAQLDVGLA